MKTWWDETAWPWLKANWQWVLFPIGMAMVLFRVFASRQTPVVIVDPTAAADERAKIEEETRTKALAAERARLAQTEKAILDKEAADRAALEAKQRGETQELREDPAALTARLLAEGKRR